MDASFDQELAPLPSLRGFLAASAADGPDSPSRLQAVLRVLAEAARAAASRPGGPAAPDPEPAPSGSERGVAGVTAVR
jgi:hypothetical protein